MFTLSHLRWSRAIGNIRVIIPIEKSPISRTTGVQSQESVHKGQVVMTVGPVPPSISIADTMTLQSDLTINVWKFQPDAASDEVKSLNEYLMDTMKKGPKWYDVGAAKYRAMRANGETVFPRPIVLDRGRNSAIPSREHGRDIPCRVMTPETGVAAEAVFMHIHGGGFVLSSEKE